MEERTERNPLGDADNPLMRPSVARAVREMRSQAPMRAANGIFKHPSECTEEEYNFIADCLKRNIPLYTIAGMIHCERSFLSRYIHKHPELLELKEEQGENIVDEAEYQLDRLNRAGNASTIIFTLQTKGRKRGWTTEDIAGGEGGSEQPRIVMGVIPDEAVKAAEEEIEKVVGPKQNPGGVMTDPMAIAAMEQMGKEVKEYVDNAIEDAKPKAVDADSVEIGGAPYAGEGAVDAGMEYGANGFGAANPSMGAETDPWAEGGDSPFFQ